MLNERSELGRRSSQAPEPCEWPAGPGSAQPIASSTLGGRPWGGERELDTG